jgi:hypothetical protein
MNAPLIAVLVALVAPAAAPTSTGFRVPGRPFGPPRIVCATNLPHRVGLYCASPLIKPNTYDGRRVLKLTPTGTVATIPGGNDILLAIETNPDHRRPWPTLSPGQSWSGNGYHCTKTTTAAVRCRRGSHGFVLTTRLRVF